MNPLTEIYGAATALRNRMYDRGTLGARALEKPVVSIGNLSVGGSGKTPFVIALGQLLKERGVSFDVLSRGYRRKTTGILVVDPKGTAAEFGDEPLLITRKLAVPVVIGESRYRAGLLAEKMFQSKLHVLDDGFQHRSLARSLDIVLMTDSDFRDRLLPSGRLREPLSSLGRADAVVLPDDISANHPALRGKLVWRIARKLIIPDLPKSPVVFCGIARPEQFFSQVRAAGISPAAELKFPDHHCYEPRDIHNLRAARRDLPGDGFVTTEKDAINLASNCRILDRLVVAVLEIQLDNPADIVDTILKRIGI